MAFYMRRPGSFTLVAEAEGSEVPGHDVLGFIVAETRRKSGHIITIDVVAEARRAGGGSALVRAGEDQKPRGGGDKVALQEPANQEAAGRVYNQRGYFVETTLAGY